MVISQEITLDQSFTPHIDLGCHINEGTAFVAQTYTAGLSGILSGVRLNVLPKASLNSQAVFAIYPLRVAIRQVQRGFPGTTILGEVTVPDGSAPPERLITFPYPILQEAGAQYAIVVNYGEAPAAGVGRGSGTWYGSTGDQYPLGELFYGPEGETWYTLRTKHCVGDG